MHLLDETPTYEDLRIGGIEDAGFGEVTMPTLRWQSLVSDNRAEYASSLDRAFGLSKPQSYLDDFPVWDPATTLSEMRYQIGGWFGNRLVTTASVRFVEYAFDESATFPIGLIGAVATHPEFRGRGFGSESLDLLLQAGRKRGVRAYALWGAESPLYAKRGFRFGGVQLRTALAHVAIEGSHVTGFEVRNGWDPEIARHLLARRTGVRYRDEDVRWLSRHRGVEWRTLWLDGNCLAYCGWNRGIDLPNILHEIEGSPEGVRALLGFMKSRYPQLELLHHPRHAALGVRALASAEALAQFLFEGADHPFAARTDEIWFSGMDSC
jgi:GNAT superfamily N-acetyltransferase